MKSKIINKTPKDLAKSLGLSPLDVAEWEIRYSLTQKIITVVKEEGLSVTKVPKLLHAQRKRLDDRVKRFFSKRETEPPRNGWLRAIRESLGLSTRQLASRLQIKHPGVTGLEKRELKRSATLESLDKAAKAMDCKLVYAIVPKEDKSFEEILERRALNSAENVLSSVSHSMELEEQGVSKAKTSKQTKKLAKELLERLDKSLWEQ